MTKPKRAPKPKPPKKPYERTLLPGGVDRLIQICEDLRTRNTDGYIRKSLWLADVKSFGFRGRVTKATVCSPFTGTVIGMAFDTRGYPRDDLNGDPYVPMFNGGKDELPYGFYKMHNDDDKPIGSIVEYNLGEKIDPKKMRRGDLLGIDWAQGGGHAVFCWDVHLNADGDVDCFQMIGSHGSLKGNGSGVHIHGCTGERWLTGKPARFNEPGTGDMKKAPGKSAIFVDEDEIVQNGTWFALKSVKFKDIDTTTFRKEPLRIAAAGTKNYRGSYVGEITVGRFFYDGAPRAPFCMKDGPPAPVQKAPEPRGHVVVPVTPVPRATIKKDPEAVKKVAPKPVVQEKKKPLMMQKDIEMAMQAFFKARWITADPGVPDDIGDDKSKAAVKAFQDRFGLDDDGIVGKQTFATIKKQLPACLLHEQAEEHLTRLFLGGVLKSDPGSPNGVNDAASEKAFKEFQAGEGLKETGVPDAETQVKLKAAVEKHRPSESQPGLSPTLEALYWLGNQAAPKGSGKLRLHSQDLRVGTEFRVFLKSGSQEFEAKARFVARADQSEAAIPMPAEWGAGTAVLARVEGPPAGGKKLELACAAPLYITGAPAVARVYRKWRITTYHVGAQKEASADETVPVYDKSKNLIARVTAAYFSEIALEGTGKLRDGRLINVEGSKVSVSHDEYATVLAHHKKYLVKRDGTMRPYGYSGLVVKDDRVVQVSAFHEVSDAKLGKGFGTQRGIAYEPFRTLAADLGAYKNSDPRYKDKGGLVPAKTKVHIKQYEGKTCPDGQGGTFVHDGWFVVNDTGGGIFGAHFDVFVGTKAMGKQVPHQRIMDVSFDGIEDRVPADYELGLND